MIRVPQVRVVDEEGSQRGVMPTLEALRLAQERGYDLVEVAPMASPPVVRFLDFGQYKYELTKREKEAKRKQRSVTFKEVRLKPKIGQGDFDTKVRRAIEFLEEGDRIKVSVQFRGRELTHPEIGRGLLTRFTDQIKDHGIIERAPLLEGKSMHITVASIHKPKSHEAPATGRPNGEETDLNGSTELGTPAIPVAAAAAPAQTPAPIRAATPAPAETPATTRAATPAPATAAAPARPKTPAAAPPAPSAKSATSAPAKPATSEPAKPATSEPAKPATSEPAKPATSEPAKPASPASTARPAAARGTTAQNRTAPAARSEPATEPA
jgi:translation initiation factor IF-3